MTEMIPVISVTDVVGTTLCVSSEDGERLCDVVRQYISSDKRVQLSFQGVENLTSAFLNAAIGQLYGQFSEDLIRSNLGLADMAQPDLHLLKRVVETAKRYFSDRQRFDEARREVLGYEED